MHGEHDKVDIAMPQKCAVASCPNRADNKERWMVMPHVTELSFYSCPDPELLEIWTELISHGHRKSKDLHGHTSVCSNHFPLGRPFRRSPLPTLYLRGYDDEDNDYVTARILRDTMNTDHDYPKLGFCEDKEKLGNTLAVSCEEEVEDQTVKQPLEDTALDRALSVKASLHLQQEQRESRPIKSVASPQVASSAEHGIPSVKKEKEEFFVARMDLEGADFTENSTTVKGGRGFKSRKRRNSRDTDHIYNTRKLQCGKHSRAKTSTDRNTDHQYNCRKAITGDSSSSQTPGHRDTDHMYNMPRTKLNEVNSSASSAHSWNLQTEERKNPENPAIVDKRVVDKDHMYQHSVRKNRNRPENRNVETKNSHWQTGVSAKKLSKHERKETEDRNEVCQVKKQVIKSENSVLHNKEAATDMTGGTHSYVTRQARKARKGAVKKQKRQTVPRNTCSAEDITASECNKSTRSTGTVVASPVHSDIDSEHMCDDDVRHTGVWHNDHMYVHLSTDNQERKEPPALATCFSAEGYKLEHSYANLEEVRYDACVNCSQLVRQLIGTIRQQGDHIDDLKKKLHAANARNKQLTSLFSQKSESSD